CACSSRSTTRRSPRNTRRKFTTPTATTQTTNRRRMAFDPLSAAMDLGGKLIDRFFPDPAKKAEAALQLLQLQQSGELAQMAGQMDINKTEAASGSLFVAGWRPFVGWCCGAAMAWNYVAGPIVGTISQFRLKPIMFVPVDTTTMMPVLLGML